MKKEEEITYDEFMQEDPLSAPAPLTQVFCDDCGKTYKSKGSLRHHKRRLHSDNKYKLQ